MQHTVLLTHPMKEIPMNFAQGKDSGAPRGKLVLLLRPLLPETNGLLHKQINQETIRRALIVHRRVKK